LGIPIPIFRKNATDHQLKVTTASLGTFGNFRGLQLLHHWSEQIAKIAQRILMIMTMSITTVQRIVAIAFVFYYCYYMLSSWLSLIIIFQKLTKYYIL